MDAGKKFNIEIPNKWLRPLPWSIVFVAFAVAKTILAFNGLAIMGYRVFPVLHIMYKTVVFSGLVAIRWYIGA